MVQAQEWLHDNTAPAAQPELVWIDLETTGLVPSTSKLLEVGVVVTDWNGRTVEDAVFHSYVMSFPDELEIDSMVLDMHKESGLWTDLRATRLTSEQPPVGVLDETLSKFLLDVISWHDFKEKPYLAGSSVHFDRYFMNVHLPKTAQLLHYRNLEISGIREVGERMVGYKTPDTGFKVHRAIPDLVDSIQTYQDLVGAFFTPKDEL